MMRDIYLILLLGILIMSCGKDDECLEPKGPAICMENYDGPLDILWSAPVHPDTLLGNSIHPVIYEDHILYSKLWLERENVIYSFDPDTGERQWEWSELPYVGEVIQFNNPTQGYDDKFYFNYSNHKILIDVEKPSTEWISFRNFSDTRVSVGEEHLYYVQFYDENNNGLIIDSEIFRSRKNKEPGWESVYFEKGNLGGRILFETPAEWISPANDTMLIFSKSRVEVPTRSNLIAYNITKDTIAWEIVDLANTAFTTYHIPIIVDDLAYITNARTISCVDLITGVELWETEDLDTGFSNCAPIIAEDKLIVNGDDGRLRGINLSDGSVAWRNDESKTGPINMAYYEGGVYYCNDADRDSFFFGIDPQTGEFFMMEESPNQDCKPGAEFSYGVSIDQETGRLYTLDGYFALCIQLEPR